MIPGDGWVICKKRGSDTLQKNGEILQFTPPGSQDQISCAFQEAAELLALHLFAATHQRIETKGHHMGWETEVSTGLGFLFFLLLNNREFGGGGRLFTITFENSSRESISCRASKEPDLSP